MKNIKNKRSFVDTFLTKLFVLSLLTIPFWVYLIGYLVESLDLFKLAPPQPAISDRIFAGLATIMSLIFVFIFIYSFYILIHDIIIHIKRKNKLRKLPLTKDELKENGLDNFDSFSKYIAEEIGYFRRWHYTFGDFIDEINETKVILRHLFIQDYNQNNEICDITFEKEKKFTFSKIRHKKINENVVLETNPNGTVDLVIILKSK